MTVALPILFVSHPAVTQSQHEAEMAQLQMYYSCGRLSALATLDRLPQATVDDLVVLAKRDCEGPRSMLLSTRYGADDSIEMIDREFAEQVGVAAEPYVLGQ